MSGGWKSDSPHAGRLNHRQVLVVEDEPLIALELEALLADAGAVVLGPAGDVDEALELADHWPLEAALLDVRLGGQTVARVAEALERRGAPFAFYTGQAETDQVRQRWPDAPVLMKPSPAAEVVACMERLCRSGPREAA